MALLSAEQAATRLHKTERTVRRWINEGLLTATHPTHGRKDKFLIEESEVERLAGELASEQPEQRLSAAASEDTSSLETRIAQLEQRITELERIISAGIPAQPAAAEHTRTRTPRASVTTDAHEPIIIAPLQNLPKGSMPYRDFANRHGVNPRTFLDHIIKGHVTVLEREIPNRPKEKARWLTPEQQRQAISYWQEINTPFEECLLCPHTDEIYQRAGESLDTGEQG